MLHIPKGTQVPQSYYVNEPHIDDFDRKIETLYLSVSSIDLPLRALTDGFCFNLHSPATDFRT